MHVSIICLPPHRLGPSNKAVLYQCLTILLPVSVCSLHPVCAAPHPSNFGPSSSESLIPSPQELCPPHHTAPLGQLPLECCGLGIVPRGWELPTLPSTGQVCVGGTAWRGGVSGRQDKGNHQRAPSGAQGPGANN
jgi:hypothetical protein